jgi:hypothetical protein
MALFLSGTVRDAELNAIEAAVNGTGAATLEIRSGAVPANCAAADTGTALAIVTLGADWLAAASGGVIAKTGPAWTDTSADNTGTAAYFRIKGGTTCHIQGTVGTSASDMIVDNVSFNAGQQFTINSFSITMGNA